MAEVRLTQAALRDLDDVWDALAERDARAASQYVRSLRERIDVLAEYPEMGRRREDLASNLRAFVFGDFVVFYLPDDAGVVLARVLHHRRDVRPNLWGWLKEGP